MANMSNLTPEAQAELTRRYQPKPQSSNLDLAQLIQQYSPQRDTSFGGRMRGAASGFMTGLTGVDPYKQQEDAQGDIAKLLMMKQIEQKFQEQDPYRQAQIDKMKAEAQDPYGIEKYRQEQQIKSEFERQDPRYQAELAAMTQPDLPIPTATPIPQRYATPEVGGEYTQGTPFIRQRKLEETIPTNAPLPTETGYKEAFARPLEPQNYGTFQGMWDAIPQVERSGYLPKPITKQIKGITKVVGYEPIPKSNLAQQKFDIQQEEKSLTNQKKSDQIRNDAQTMVEAIKEAKKGLEFFGPLGEVKSFPGVTGLNYNKRINWESNMDQILAKKGLDIMMQLKEASRTGATGFGNLSEAEGAWLRQASTVLNKKLSPEDAKRYLDKMQELYEKVLGGTQTSGAGGGFDKESDPLGLR